MSNARWCDPGGHAYPEGQPGSTTITLAEQVANQWGGTQPHNAVQDVCAACARDLGYVGVQIKLTQAELNDRAERARSGKANTWFRPDAIAGAAVAETVDDRD